MASINNQDPVLNSSEDSSHQQLMHRTDGKKSSESDSYFASYDSLEVHELMLKDKPRTCAYKSFIEKNAELFKDKVIVDVGAGTGILSMFAARAGAKQVYAIEASQIGQVCEHLVVHNGLSEQITVIHGRVEDVSLPQGVQADIIISEWMGFYLLHESMLSSVIVARDKWLKPDGIMLPSSAALYICPVSTKQHYKDNFDFWQDVYGFDFSPVLPVVQAKQLSQPVITTLSHQQCLSSPELVTYLDLLYVGMDELENITGSFNFRSLKNDVLHGFACWFDVEFDGPSHTVTLSTGPAAEETHWKQTVVMLPYPLLVCKDEELNCTLSLRPDPDRPRWYNISIEMPEDQTDSDDDDDVDQMVEDDADRVTQDLLLSAMDKNQGSQ